MAEPEVRINDTPAEGTPAGDVEMGGSEETPARENTETAEPAGAGEGEEPVAEMADIEPEAPKRETFLEFLKSPIIELLVGKGEEQTLLTAHQALLVKSPYFETECAKFEDGDDTKRRIELPDEDLDATGSLLEYLYHGEYFPKRTSDHKDAALEQDPTIPTPDEQGVGLLKHARVYNLADKFGLPALKSLAHTKIHRTQSTAKGEIAYARYVYAETSPEDTTIRRPVAAFWAHRSHVLRHEAEAEFRAMCLQYPQFGFDVLSLVLDAKEKRARPEDPTPTSSQSVPGERSARKRARAEVRI
ncbi:uncharacterized protein K452DRAFT_291010 [Aplosporella prunicola CBS 121167]|uniref:BTB domain-containing protein n=1 Tax=Aplosporella prunicola CBS 121167 TaxID=1176127 RepID=A0A6A6B3Z1_9PEZI|nr:uncharacterized protein K452DRAFT_291010 [Aplosporella prunicola CBS 121167]KAF2137975.1 hypothetical protein K452DRAFT_291010 [Aplosporella prunicola CBS 121167]